MKKLKPISRLLIALSALLMISAYYVPVWQILMWAPQYPEGLNMKIWIDNITGDVKIISALNHYIGMKHIDAAMFPEFKYLGYIVAGLIAIGLLAALVNRKKILVIYSCVVVLSGIAALADLYRWGYDYGHNLDPTAAIIVPGMSYQPPLIGTKQLLNFTAFSGPDVGGWIFFVTGILAIGTLAFEMYSSRIRNKANIIAFAASINLLLLSCTTEPQPLVFGKDSCHVCKMTLMDNRFGAEIVTKKGKVYKFDDLNCMLNFYNSAQVNSGDIAHTLVVDFATPGKLVDAKKALFVKSEKINSPMASNVAAFETKEPLDVLNKEWQGKKVIWKDLQTQFN